jgi:hypothetical protein
MARKVGHTVTRYLIAIIFCMVLAQTLGLAVDNPITSAFGALGATCFAIAALTSKTN